jgi:hypothetical protein
MTTGGFLRVIITAATGAALAAGPAPASAQIWEKLTNKKTIVPIHHPPQLVLKGITRVAVMEFKGDCGAEITEKMTDVVSRSQKYELVDRASLDSILGEQSLQQSETVSAATTAKLGQMLGAAVLVTGRIARCNTRVGEPLLERQTGFVIRRSSTPNYVVKTTTTVTGGMQVIDVTSGKVLARAPIQVNHVVERRGDSPYIAPADPEDVKTGGYAQVADILTRMVMGWDEEVAVLLYDDDKWNLKQSANQLRVGDMEGAIQTLKASLETNGQGANADPKMLSKTLYNLGLALMYSDQLEEGQQVLQRSNVVRPTDIAQETLAQCRKLIATRDETITKEKNAVAAGATMAVDASKPMLTNTEIINMSRARLPETVILSKIKSSTCRFDGSPDALVKLRGEGVTDNVLVAIVERAK